MPGIATILCGMCALCSHPFCVSALTHTHTHTPTNHFPEIDTPQATSTAPLHGSGKCEGLAETPVGAASAVAACHPANAAGLHGISWPRL